MLYCGINKIQILNSVLWLFFYSQCFHSLPHLFCITDPACSLSFMFCVPIINNRGKSETFPHSLKKRERERRNYWPICSEHRDISQNDNLIITRANFLKCQEFFFFTSKRYYIRQKAKWSFLYAALLFILATTESNLLCLYMYQVKYCPGVYLQKLPRFSILSKFPECS